MKVQAYNTRMVRSSLPKASHPKAVALRQTSFTSATNYGQTNQMSLIAMAGKALQTRLTRS